MDTIKKLLLENKAWAKSKTDANPDYFKNMAGGQSPQILWIGCADSRVPETTIANAGPGDIFVHRNIANLALHTDMSLLSVIEYAVHYLGVPHIVVCGHYNCGGVKAALGNQSLGLIDNWVRNVKDTYFANQSEIDMIKSEGDRVNRLVELNVLEQVRRVSQTAIVQSAWKKNNLPHIHGVVYDLNNGQLKELATIEAGSKMDSTHRYDF